MTVGSRVASGKYSLLACAGISPNTGSKSVLYSAQVALRITFRNTPVVVSSLPFHTVLRMSM